MVAILACGESALKAFVLVGWTVTLSYRCLLVNRVMLKPSGIENRLLAIGMPAVAMAALTRMLLAVVSNSWNRTLKGVAVGFEVRCNLFRQAKVGARVRVVMLLAVLVRVRVSSVVSGWWTGSAEDWATVGVPGRAWVGLDWGKGNVFVC